MISFMKSLKMIRIKVQKIQAQMVLIIPIKMIWVLKISKYSKREYYMQLKYFQDGPLTLKKRFRNTKEDTDLVQRTTLDPLHIRAIVQIQDIRMGLYLLVNLKRLNFHLERQIIDQLQTKEPKRKSLSSKRVLKFKNVK